MSASAAIICLLIMSLLAASVVGIEPVSGQSKPDEESACQTVDLGRQRLIGLLGTPETTDPVGVDLPDGTYEVVLEFEDLRHRNPIEPDQDNERWLLEGLDGKGQIVFTTSKTEDLASGEIVGFDNVGSVAAAAVTRVRARHAGRTDVANSIVPVRASFLSDSCTSEPCPVADFGSFRLLGFNNSGLEVTPTEPLALADGAYRVTLRSADPLHAKPGTDDQPHESWLVEGLNAKDEVVFASDQTEDLPASVTESTTTVGLVRAQGVVGVRGRHANADKAAPNSIEAVTAHFDNGRCDGIDTGDDRVGPPSRLSTIGAAEGTVVLQWFPGTSTNDPLTYEVFVDGEATETGITGLSYEVVNLDPGATTTFAVRARDGAGLASRFAEIVGGAESADLCAGRIVTVDLSLGQSPTEEADVILGTPEDDVILGLGGDDAICGNGGNDRIEGGDGDDVILASDGQDTVVGGAGSDEIAGLAGDDVLDGGPGDDRIYGGEGMDAIDGGAQDDLIDGGPGDDNAFGRDGNDVLVGSSGADTLTGGAGDDDLLGGGDADVLRGDGPGVTPGGDDSLEGGVGDDQLFGNGGDDEILGQLGDDVIDGGPGADRLVGGDGANTMDGGEGPDVFVRPSPESIFLPAADDRVEEIPIMSDMGGFFEDCTVAREPIRGEGEFECNVFQNLFEYAGPTLAAEYGMDLYFDCELSLVPGVGGGRQCRRGDSEIGLPDNFRAFNGEEYREYQRAYSNYRLWGLGFPHDVYDSVVNPPAPLPVASTVLLFRDDSSFRSRSVKPGLIEYGTNPDLSQAAIARDLFRQFMFATLTEDEYLENQETLDSLASWAARRVIAGDDDPLPCIEDFLCSRSRSLGRGEGTLIWEFLYSQADGYGFIGRLLLNLAIGQSFNQAMNQIVGRRWEEDFLQTGLRRPDIGGPLAPTVRDIGTDSFTVRWQPVDGASSYEILVGNTLWVESIPQPVGGPGAAALSEEIDVGGSGGFGLYSVQVRAINRFGRAIDSETISVRTLALDPGSTDFVDTANLTVGVERCLGLGGEIYLDESARAGGSSLVSGFPEVARGCYDLGESPCLAELVGNPGEEVDCEDAVTRAIEPLDSETPRIRPLRVPGTASITGLSTFFAFDSAGSTTLVVAGGASAATGVGVALSSAGITYTTLVIAGGVLAVVVIVGIGLYFYYRSVRDRPPIPCNQLAFAVPTGFDGTRPDFSLYRDQDAMKQLTQCPELANPSNIYGTIMHTVYDREPDIGFSDEDEIARQVRRLCGGEGIDCDDQLVVYVPGGSTSNGGAHRDTGLHIRDALRDGPTIWHYPAYTGSRDVGRWYDRPEWRTDNPCVGRTAPRGVCDEFPFATTDQRIDMSGTRASLRPVLNAEASTQGTELSTFYRQCLDNEVNKRFVVISPPEAYIEARGRSFAFEISPWRELPEPCL